MGTKYLIGGSTHTKLGIASVQLVDFLNSMEFSSRRVGFIGMGDIMRAADYKHLTANFKAAEIVDLDDAFEELRSIKDHDDIKGHQEANAIAEMSLKSITEALRIGKMEREIAGDGLRTLYSSGGDDTIILSLYGSDGNCIPFFHAPRSDYKLRKNDVFIFSIEVSSPSGHWVELSRMFYLGEPTDLTQRLHKFVADSLIDAETQLKPGKSGEEIFSFLNKGAKEQHFKLEHEYQGHSIGLDVIERPFIRSGEKMRLREGMVISFHPIVADKDDRSMGYMSNVYVVGKDGASPLSKLPLDPIYK